MDSKRLKNYKIDNRLIIHCCFFLIWLSMLLCHTDTEDVTMDSVMAEYNITRTCWPRIFLSCLRKYIHCWTFAMMCSALVFHFRLLPVCVPRKVSCGDEVSIYFYGWFWIWHATEINNESLGLSCVEHEVIAYAPPGPRQWGTGFHHYWRWGLQWLCHLDI